MNVRHEGLAGTGDWQARQFAVLEPDGDEPPYTIADAWTPPHPLALDADMVALLLDAAHACQPITTPTGDYHLPDLDAATTDAIAARFAAANEAWWHLDVDAWDVMVKHYRPGQRHVAHQDTHAGAATRKVAGIAQLSQPGDYTGGHLVVHFAGERLPLPRDAGTLIALPGWTVHEVEPVHTGERWSLIVNGRGNPLR